MTNMEGRYRGKQTTDWSQEDERKLENIYSGYREAGQTSSLPLRIERPVRGDEDQSTPGIPHTV